MIVACGGWSVGCAEDVDGHLTLWLEHGGGGQVVEVGCGWEPVRESEWQGRFSTGRIEREVV